MGVLANGRNVHAYAASALCSLTPQKVKSKGTHCICSVMFALGTSFVFWSFGTSCGGHSQHGHFIPCVSQPMPDEQCIVQVTSSPHPPKDTVTHTVKLLIQQPVLI